MLEAKDIEERLGAESPWRVYSYETVTTTMAEAQRLAEQGEDEFALVVADCQTAGSGRFDRRWYSPPGEGVWMTALFRPDLSPERVPLLTLASAVSVAEALGDLGFSVGIKWPNDVLAASGPFRRRKLCGIRAEMAVEGDRVAWASSGIGINVGAASFPEELSGIAASLQELAGAPVSRMACACAVLERLEANYRCLLEDGFSPIRRSWIDHAIGLGEPVRISDVDGEVSGVSLGIDGEGRLLVEVPDEGVRTILSGDLVFEVRASGSQSGASNA